MPKINPHKSPFALVPSVAVGTAAALTSPVIDLTSTWGVVVHISQANAGLAIGNTVIQLAPSSTGPWYQIGAQFDESPISGGTATTTRKIPRAVRFLRTVTTVTVLAIVLTVDISRLEALG